MTAGAQFAAPTPDVGSARVRKVSVYTAPDVTTRRSSAAAASLTRKTSIVRKVSVTRQVSATRKVSVTARERKRSACKPPSRLSALFGTVRTHVVRTVVKLIILVWCFVTGWFDNWLRWVPSSMSALQTAEKKILSCLKTAYTCRYVDIGNRIGNQENKIWTLIVNGHKKATPMVLIHGFGAGLGLWILNLDAIAKNRPVYAVDLLGFGRSSRPKFSSDALEAEVQLVESLEDWRRELKLDKFILLGHSLGGFLATSYALRYPDKVKHLILADPWGFGERSEDKPKLHIPMLVKAAVTVLQPFNPLAALRAAGPWGPRLIEKLRPDIKRKFASVVEDDPDAVPTYIFHCNAQNPSGETAFKAMTEKFGWAKWPMINRVGGLATEIPMTIIYGSRSWIDQAPGYQIKKMRTSSRVIIHVIQGAGHHVYADHAQEFNNLVISACNHEDKQESYSEEEAKAHDEENVTASGIAQRKWSFPEETKIDEKPESG